MNKPFYTLTVGGEDYRLCFSSAAVVQLEEKLGEGLMSIFTNQDKLMSVGVQVALFHASLQKYHHGKKMTDACELYDEILNESGGDGMMVIATALMGAMRASGFMPPSEETEVENNAKATGKKVKLVD